jgi:hypothetical protein
MDYKLILLSGMLMFGIALSGLKAQEAVLASGGEASGSAGTVHYSVGLVFYTTSKGTTGTVAEGVQQPYEISIVSASESVNEGIQSIQVYPNPVTDHLNLVVNYREASKLSYQLYDMKGNLLENSLLTRDETLLDMSKYAPATYFVRVIKCREEIITFKIIKK